MPTRSSGAPAWPCERLMDANLANRLGRLMVGGVSCLVLVFLAVPLIVVVAISFTTTEYLRFPPVGMTTRWYAAVFGHPTFVEAFIVSSELAALATVLALLLGVPAALVLSRKDFWGS